MFVKGAPDMHFSNYQIKHENEIWQKKQDTTV